MRRHKYRMRNYVAAHSVLWSQLLMWIMGTSWLRACCPKLLCLSPEQNILLLFWVSLFLLLLLFSFANFWLPEGGLWLKRRDPHPPSPHQQQHLILSMWRGTGSVAYTARAIGQRRQSGALGKVDWLKRGADQTGIDLALTNVLPSRHLHKQQWANNRQTARVHEAERPQRISTVKSFRSLFRLNVYSFLSPTHLLAQRTFSTIGSTRASSFYIIVPFWMLRLLTQCLVTLCNRYRLIISIKQLNSSKNQPVISCWWH